MSKIDELIAEAERVQGVINNINGLIENPQPVSTLGKDFSSNIQKYGPVLVNKLMPQFQKALKNGQRPDQAIITAVVLGVGLAGAYGIDAIRNASSIREAKKLLLGYYKELAVKQDMLVEEQQKLIAVVCAENAAQGEELQQAKEKLLLIQNQLQEVYKVNQKRSV